MDENEKDLLKVSIDGEPYLETKEDDKSIASAKKDDKNKSPKKDDRSVFEKLGVWFKEIIAEFHKVTWPNRKDLTKMTITVVITSIIFGVLITGMDAAFGAITRFLIQVL